VAPPGGVLQETESEKLVQLANRYYRRENLSRVKKNDPHMRFVRGQGVIFSGSSGLDFSGLKTNGQYISFEVKEIRGNSLPMQKIRTVQFDTMESESKLGADTFLLVFFSEHGEWYRLTWDNLDELLELGATSIPIRYFRAFGMSVPAPRGFPEYLSPESYPGKNGLKKDYPTWLPTTRRQRKIVRYAPVDHQDPEARKARIKKAMERGTKNALRKEEINQAYKLRN
jgi:penicillin-binding protein-related factor A (putative recombinase)